MRTWKAVLSLVFLVTAVVYSFLHSWDAATFFLVFSWYAQWQAEHDVFGVKS